jgi:hypothetical protein
MKRYLIILVIIICTVMSIRSYFDHKGLAHVWSRENYWLKKANPFKNYDTVVIGDSRIYQSMNPDLLLNENDLALNFGFSSISFTKHYLDSVDKIIKDGGIIFIGLTAESLTTYEGDKSLLNYQKKGPLIIHQTLRWIRLHWPNIELQRWIKWRQVPLFQNRPLVTTEIYHDNGWLESNLPEEENVQSMVNHYRELSQRFKIDSTILQDIDSRIKQWNKRNIKIFVFWTCFEEKVCLEEAPLLTTELRSKIEHDFSSAGATWLDLSGRKFKTFDGDHLTGPEAVRFSLYINEKIKTLKSL